MFRCRGTLCLPGAAVLTMERPRALWWSGALFFSGKEGFLCSMMLRLSGAALFRPLLDTKFRHGGASSRGGLSCAPARLETVESNIVVSAQMRDRPPL